MIQRVLTLTNDNCLCVWYSTPEQWAFTSGLKIAADKRRQPLGFDVLRREHAAATERASRYTPPHGSRESLRLKIYDPSSQSAEPFLPC